MKRGLPLLLVLIFLGLPLAAKKKASPPDWVRKVHWEDATYHYYVGVSTKAKTEEEGRREALDNATAEAIQSLFGISGRMDLTSFSTLQKIQISQDVFVSSGEVRLKPQTIEIYVEKEKENGETRYNVHRSIKVKKSEAKSELERLKKQAMKKETTEGKVMAPSKDLVAVTVEGQSVVLNDDEPEAKSKAVRVALGRSCERLLKEWFYEETLTKNYRQLKTTIYDRCSGFSENYNIINGYRDENLYKMKLTVNLKKGVIRQKLRDLGLHREKTPRR